MLLCVRFNKKLCCLAYPQIDRLKLLLLSAAGDTIMGEPHLIKWPIARVVVMDIDKDQSKIVSIENKTEFLLRYRCTPAVAADEATLVYSHGRTPGICSVWEFWPGCEDLI